MGGCLEADLGRAMRAGSECNTHAEPRPAGLTMVGSCGTRCEAAGWRRQRSVAAARDLAAGCERRLRPGDGRRPAASVGRSDGAASDGPEWGARHRGRMPGAMFPKLRSGARPARTVRSAGACRWRLKAVLGAIELRARTELAKRQRGSWDKREHERRKGCENRCRWAGAAACDPRGAWRACACATYCWRLQARAGVKPCLATSHGR